MREVVVFLDEAADLAIAGAAAFLRERGLALTHQSEYSIAFAAPASGPLPAIGVTGVVGADSAGEGTLPPGTGQFAAVPIQLRPAWCRVWVTVEGAGPAADAAAHYVESHRERSRRTEAAVRALEVSVYDEASWPAYEATLRASLSKQGADAPTIDAKVAAFKQRWLALGRKAAKAPPEDHLSA